MGVVKLEAAAALYTSAKLEELRPFAIVERILELWLAGGCRSARPAQARARWIASGCIATTG